jgi:hypothetical protein
MQDEYLFARTVCIMQSGLHGQECLIALYYYFMNLWVSTRQWEPWNVPECGVTQPDFSCSRFLHAGVLALGFFLLINACTNVGHRQ